METSQTEGLRQEFAEISQDMTNSTQARAALELLTPYLDKRRAEILDSFRRLDSLNEREFMFGALAVQAALGAVDNLEACLKQFLERGDAARFRLKNLQEELQQASELEQGE